VPIPAGEHEVEFRFEPSSLKLGLTISVISLLLVVVAVILAGRLPRQSRTTSP
jgi:uncharacterized membrane protein YfhO